MVVRYRKRTNFQKIDAVDAVSDFPYTDLVAYYKLNWDSTDSSGNWNNWTDSNITYVNWHIWQCASLWTTSCIKITNSWQFNFDNLPFTISMWINPTTRWTNNATLIDFESPWWWWWLLRHNVSTWNLSWNSDQQLSSGSPSAWVWTHVLFTSNGTNGKMYFNGVLNYTQASLIYNWNSVNIYWIWGNADDPTQWFQWLIDEVWIRSRALTPTEIAALYNWWAWITY